MDIPINLPLPGQLGVFHRKEPFRDRGREDDIDECICEKGADDFVNMERKCREVEVVRERLYGFTEPFRWWDGEGVLHGRGGGIGKR